MPAKKATPKKASAKKPAKKKSAKKTTPKKAAAKKPAKKAVPGKKSIPKKTVAKKSAAKKAPAKRAAGKKSAPKKKEAGRSALAGTPELERVSCQIASLALAQEEGPLSVRQREQLRRALAAAGEELGWIENLSGNGASLTQFTGDVITMAKNGAKSLGLDLAEQLAYKKTEIAQLNEVILFARELAEDPDTVYPADITFSHTIRDPFQLYVTKTETRVANDADEARSAAATVERSMTSWSKLAEAMIVDLKRRQKQLERVTDALPDFVASSRDLLRAVVANLA